MNRSKPLILRFFPGDFLSRNKGLAVPCGIVPADCTSTSQSSARELTRGVPLFDGQDFEALGGAPPPVAASPSSEREANAQFARIVIPHLDDAYALARWMRGHRAAAAD